MKTINFFDKLSEQIFRKRMDYMRAHMGHQPDITVYLGLNQWRELFYSIPPWGIANHDNPSIDGARIMRVANHEDYLRIHVEPAQQ